MGTNRSVPTPVRGDTCPPAAVMVPARVAVYAGVEAARVRAHAGELQTLKHAWSAGDGRGLILGRGQDPEVLAESLKTVASICADQMIDERELFALLEAEGCLREALDLREHLRILNSRQQQNLKTKIF